MRTKVIHECKCQPTQKEITCLACRKCQGKLVFEMDIGFDLNHIAWLGHLRCLNCGRRIFLLSIEDNGSVEYIKRTSNRQAKYGNSRAKQYSYQKKINKEK